MASGSTGNGLGASNLLTNQVFTGSDGSFTITGDYTCPLSSTQVYLVASGGNPGISAMTNNTASVLVVALGDCGNLSSSTYIFVNEVTTVAAAWALAPFMSPGAIVGSSATNANGLRNAFLLAANLANTTSGTVGGTALPPTATMESAKLNSLANSLSTCVNSSGGAPCTTLFSAATAGGITPATTLDSALNIVRNPASNVSAVLNVALPASPFQPTLSQTPHDWTMSITYSGGGLANPAGLAVDSTGSVWAANYFGGVATKLSSTGVPASATGFADPDLNESWSVAIDNQDSAWITNEETHHGVNGDDGSLSKFSSTGQLLSGPGFYSGSVYYPYAVAADPNGELWVADYGHSQTTLMANNGNGIATFSSSSLPFPVAVAVDGSHNAWFAAQQSVSMVTPTGAITQFACCREPAGLAIDAHGSVWVADYSASKVEQLSSTGATLQTVTGGGLTNPNGIAIDGAGAAWAVNYRGNSLSAFSAASGGTHSTPLSPAAGLGLDANLNEPFGIALDASGNVWLSNFGGFSVTELVGLATPVRTPLNGPAVAP